MARLLVAGATRPAVVPPVFGAMRIDALLEDYAATRDEHLGRRLAKLLDEQPLDRPTGDVEIHGTS